MATITRIQFIWTGFTGAPGYSNFYFNGTLTAPQLTGAANAIRGLFDGVKAYLPNIAVVGCNAVANVNDLNGPLQSQPTIPTPPANVVGTGGTNYAGGLGFVIHWMTGSFRNGRQTRGKTFFVPASTSAFGPDGTVNSTALGILTTAAAAYLAACAAVPALPIVWSTDGTTSWAVPVTLPNVPDRSAVMRSRRT